LSQRHQSIIFSVTTFMRHIRAPALLFLLTATTALAQAAAPVPVPVPVPAAKKPERVAVIGLNPLALLFGAVLGDFERAVSPAFTAGLGVSVVPEYLTNYRVAEAKLRYYPDEHALHGVSLALTAGIISESYDSFDFTTNARSRETLTRPTIGTELSYQWIIGPSQRFALATGAGVKRQLGSEAGFYDGVFRSVIPTFRINVGVAF